MARSQGKRQPKPSQPARPARSVSAATATTTRETGGRLWWIVGGVGLVALIVAVVVGLAGGPQETLSMPTDVAVEVNGEDLSPYNPTAPDPAIGQPAPEVSGIDFAGDPVSIADDGRPKAIVFLAHWCPHCQREVPAFQSYINQTGLPEGVDFYSVATSISPAQPNYPPSAWLQREGWTAPVLVDDNVNSVAQAFGLTGFPFYVFIDADGNVAARVSGEQQPANVVASLEALAAG